MKTTLTERETMATYLVETIESFLNSAEDLGPDDIFETMEETQDQLVQRIEELRMEKNG